MNLHLTQYNPDELEAHYFLKKDDKEYCEIRLKKANNMVIVYHGQVFEFYSQLPGTFIANTQTYSSREEAERLMRSLVRKLSNEGYEPFPEGIALLQRGITKSIKENVEVQSHIKQEIKKSTHRLDDELLTRGYKKLHTESGESLLRSSVLDMIKSEENQSHSQRAKQECKKEILREKKEHINEDQAIEKTSYVESEDLELASPFRNVIMSGYEDEEKEEEEESVLGKLHNTSLKHFMLPSKWQNQDFDNWYICCKTGGVRCYWNGTQILSKTLKAYHVPEQFTKAFPKAFLDLELFMKNGSSDDVYEILRKNKGEMKDWKKLQVGVLDAPGLELPFSERLVRMKQVFEEIESQYISLSKYKICKNRENLMKELEVIKSKEGITSMILLDPDNMYEEGKSNTMLEIILTKQEEAEVIGYEKGKDGEGKLKKLEVKNNDGVKFSIGVGLTDGIKRNPPKIGARIKYSCQGVGKSGIPKRAKLDIIL